MAVLKYVHDTEYQIEIKFRSKVYIASTNNLKENKITELVLSETSAITTGNPVGVISPDNLNISIQLGSDMSIVGDGSSQYPDDVLTQGLKVTLSYREKGSSTWREGGIYYTNTFNVQKNGGAYGVINIQCIDRLTFISNKSLPKMQSSSNIYAVTQLRKLLVACGVANNDISISSELDNKVQIIYDRSKGVKVGEVINTLTQALIARISVRRDGVIQVQPSFPQQTGEYDEIDVSSIIDETVTLNSLGIYSKVKLEYSDVSDEETQLLYSQPNVRINNGTTELLNRKVNGTILAVDSVDISNATSSENLLLSDIRYSADQNGIDIVVTNSGDSYRGNLTVMGRTTSTSSAYVTANVYEDSRNNNADLVLTNTNIQDKSTAQNYVDEVASYLRKINNVVTLRGYISMGVEVNKYYKITNSDRLVAGVYMVTSREYVKSFDGQSTLTMVRVGV